MSGGVGYRAEGTRAQISQPSISVSSGSIHSVSLDSPGFAIAVAVGRTTQADTVRRNPRIEVRMTCPLEKI